MEKITEQAIIDFAYENDLIDSDEGGIPTVDGLYAIVTDPGFSGGSADRLSALARMIEQYRTQVPEPYAGRRFRKRGKRDQ